MKNFLEGNHPHWQTWLFHAGVTFACGILTALLFGNALIGAFFGLLFYVLREIASIIREGPDNMGDRILDVLGPFLVFFILFLAACIELPTETTHTVKLCVYVTDVGCVEPDSVLAQIPR